MTTTTRPRTPQNPRNLRASGRRLVGAVSSAAAVAVIGVTALTPQTAAAAGISTGYRHAVGRPRVPDPAALPHLTDAVDVTYRWTGTRWLRV